MMPSRIYIFVPVFFKVNMIYICGYFLGTYCPKTVDISLLAAYLIQLVKSLIISHEAS